MDVSKIDGEQYCMNCNYWKRVDGRMKCINNKAKCTWFANQLNGCDFFKGKLMSKHKEWIPMGYKPSTFSK